MSKSKPKSVDRSDLEAVLSGGIANSVFSRYAIAKETGISDSVLSRFVGGDRSLTLETATKLCRYFKFELMKVGDSD